MAGGGSGRALTRPRCLPSISRGGGGYTARGSGRRARVQGAVRLAQMATLLFQKAVLGLSLFALGARFLDYALFASRPPPGSEAAARFPSDGELQADLERHLAEMDQLDAELQRLHGHSHAHGGHGHSHGIDEDDAPLRKPRGPPSTLPPTEGQGAPPPPKLSEKEAKAHLRRFASSAFVRSVLGTGEEDLLGLERE